MRSDVNRSRQAEPVQSGRLVWLLLLTGGSLLSSAGFACAAPFAAFATLAALKLKKLDRILALGVAWIINQAIGYSLLGYPLSWNSCAWGLSIGLSMALGALAAGALAATRPGPLAISLPFASAFVAFEAGLYLTAFVLKGGEDAFGFAVISHVFMINAVALCILLIGFQMLTPILRVLRTGAPSAFSSETASSC